jgi:hypothetical protein
VQFTFWFGGQTSWGGWLSFTVTVKLQLDLFPEESVAVQVTGDTPTGKVEPEGGAQLTVVFGQLSVTVGAGYETTASQRPGLAFAIWFGGQTITGGKISLTVMVKLQVCIPHKVVVAVQVTGVTPTPQNVPGGGTQTTVPKPQGKLIEGTVKLAIAPQLFGAQFCTILEGQLIPPVLWAAPEFVSSAHSGPPSENGIIAAKINAYPIHRLRIWHLLFFQ